jgi:hypothetical protein
MLKQKNSRNLRLGVSLIATSVALLLTHQSLGDGPALMIELGRGANKSQIKIEDNGVAVVAYSSTGIGELKMKSGGAPWPMALKLRLKYNETRGFMHLEGFRLSTGKASLQTSLGREEPEIDSVDGAARLHAAKPELKVIKTDDAIEVLLPMAWLADSDEFTLRWIDLYRQ